MTKQFTRIDAVKFFYGRFGKDLNAKMGDKKRQELYREFWLRTVDVAILTHGVDREVAKEWDVPTS